MTTKLPSLGERLAGARAKVRRADEHVGGLKRALGAYLNRDPFVFRVASYDNVIIQSRQVFTGKGISRTPGGLIIPGRTPRSVSLFNSIAVRVFVSTRPETPFPAIRWGTIVGEIVHNLASALDNLVYELVAVNPSPPVSPAGSNHRGRQKFKELRDWQKFPYCMTRADWERALIKDLYFVDAASQDLLSEAQPFYAWEQDKVPPGEHPFAILHKLWNRDKHRTVNLTVGGAALTQPNLELPGLFPGHGPLRSETMIDRPFNPVVGETELAVIRVHFPSPRELTHNMNMTVTLKPSLNMSVFFGDDTPAPNENVFQTLKWARDTVVNLLNRFA